MEGLKIVGRSLAVFVRIDRRNLMLCVKSWIEVWGDKIWHGFLEPMTQTRQARFPETGSDWNVPCNWDRGKVEGLERWKDEKRIYRLLAQASIPPRSRSNVCTPRRPLKPALGPVAGSSFSDSITDSLLPPPAKSAYLIVTAVKFNATVSFQIRAQKQRKSIRNLILSFLVSLEPLAYH